ncbi:MAG TPA: ABC transporter permease [Longimicrobiaceae bacterium]|jgi:predicted permease|nr:ABC transporter permease [Longimicrobiaceae bacterium]
MDSFLQDLRFAVRTLGRSRGFAAVAVLCLGLGIGVNTAIFSMVNALLLRPFPFRDPDRVVSVYSRETRSGDNEQSSSLADLRDWKQQTRVFDGLAMLYSRNFAIAGDGEPERVEGWAATPDLFPLLGVAPALGRGFTAADAVKGGDRVAVLSDALWRRRFGGSRAAVGGKVLLNGVPFTVVGVMPPHFQFPEKSEMWVPLVPDPAEARSERYVYGVARLRPGVTPQRAQAELDAVGRRLAAEHPESNRGWMPSVETYRDDMVDGDLRTMLYLLLGAVGFVLLIACANVANLLLARATARSREIAVRAALGAGRGRLIRQLLVESVLIALAGGVLGVLIAVWWIAHMVGGIPEQLPYWIDFSVDYRVLAYTFLLSVATGVIFGIVPALRASRADVQGALKEGGRAGEGAGAGRLRGALVAGEIALSLVLLVGAAFMVRSFLAVTSADAGFRTEGLLTLRTYLAGERYAPLAARAAFFDQAVRRVEALPGVERAVATGAIPGAEEGGAWPAAAEGQPVQPGDEPTVMRVPSTPGLLAVLGQRLVAGREFTAAENADSTAAVAIVGESVARRFWPKGGALGRRIRLGTDAEDPWLTVVGIAPDLHYGEFGKASPASKLQVHVPYARDGWRTMRLLVRVRGDAGAAAGPVRRAIHAVDATLPTYDVRTMAEVRSYGAWPSRLYGEIFASFGLLALALAAVGVYGVMAYAVSQRSREIGIRMALGAQTRDVLRLVVGQGAGLAAIGIGLGMLGGAGVARILGSILYGVHAADPAAFLASPAVLACVALLASWLPARRATRVDPMTALRQD